MALTVIKEITLDMSSPSIGVVYAKQGDSSGRVVRALLTNNGEVWSVPSDAYAVIRYRKSDNIGGFYDMDEYGNSAISYVTSSDRTKVDIVLSFQALSKEGAVYMELNFYTTPGIKLSTFRWNVIVEKGVLSDDEILSGGYYNILTEQINTAVESARQASTFVGAPFVVTSPNSMTDKSRVYVYAGSSTSSYTNGHWYFWNGSKWTSGGPYSYDWQLIEVSDTQPTDEANRVWFKKTQSTISIPTMSEFNALEGLLTVPIADASLWAQGSIRSNSGANNSSTTRLRTDNYYPVKYVDKVVAAEGYKVYVFMYSEANVASYVEPYTDGFVTGEVSLLDIDRSYYVRFVLANSSDSTITEEAGVNLTIYAAADPSLSVQFAPADAKATGDALAQKVDTSELNAEIEAREQADAELADNIDAAINAEEIASIGIENGIKEITDQRMIVFKRGRYRTSTATNIDEVAYFDTSPDALNHVCGIASCSEGDCLRYHIWGSVGICRGVFFCDSDMKVISKYAISSAELSNTVYAPENTAYVIVNHNITNMSSGFYAYIGDYTNSFRTRATTLSSSDDLDLILKPGVYWWAYTNNVPINSPTTNPASLICFGGTEAGSRAQTQLLINYQNNLFIRYRTGDGWTDWSLIRKQADILATRTFSGTAITSLGLTDPYDLDSIEEMCSLTVYSSMQFANNPPFESLGGNFICLRGDTGTPIVQIFIATVGPIYKRSKISTGWTDWEKLYDSYNLPSRQVFDTVNATPITLTINGSNKWVTATSKPKPTLVPVPSGAKKISFIAKNGGVTAFLRSFSENDVAGGTPDFSREYFGDRGGVNFGKRILHNCNGKVEYRLYEDVSYIYFLLANSNGEDIAPTDIVFSYDYVPEMLQELPTLYLTGDISEMTKSNAVDLDYAAFGLFGSCTCKWQGSSSQRYVKKNYTIKFDNALDAWYYWATFKNSLRADNGNSSSVVTTSRWGNQTKYCFKANWIDPSHARNIVCARLWGQIVAKRVSDGDINDNRKDAPNYGAIDGFPIQIMLNGESLGLYTMNIPKDSWTFDMGEGEAEYVVSGEDNSKNACRWKATALVDGTDYSVEYAPDGVEDSTIAASLNTAISAAINAGANWETALANYVDIDSVFDYFIFTCCINNHDALARNILYATYDGVKWFMSAYDMDTTFGVDPYATTWFDVVNDRNQFAQAASMHQLAYLMYTYSKTKLKARYRELRSGILSEANVWKQFSNFIVDIPTRDYDIDRNIWPSMPGTSTANMAQYMEYYRMHCAYLDDEIENL